MILENAKENKIYFYLRLKDFIPNTFEKRILRKPMREIRRKFEGKKNNQFKNVKID